MPLTSAQIRAGMAEALELDLVGPRAGHPLENETLPQAPSRWYLTGFLVPFEAAADVRSDPTATEEIASGTEGGAGGDDDEAPESASARRVYFPSSIGLSVLVPKACERLEVTVAWGDYKREGADDEDEADGEDGDGEPGTADVAPPAEQAAPPRSEAKRKSRRRVWQRTQRTERVSVPLGARRKKRDELEVPGSAGLKLVVRERVIGARAAGLAPAGTRVVSLFLVNGRDAIASGPRKDESFAFQASLRVHCAEGYVPRPNPRGRDGADWDDRVADFQYRDVCEFGVGHGVATHLVGSADGRCDTIETTWIPSAEVEKVVPAAVPDVELGMEALAAVESASELAAKLTPLVDGYRSWIELQRKSRPADPRHAEVADELMRRADGVRTRIRDGIALLVADANAFEAFRIANRAMALQARRRRKDFEGTGEAPRWRPFQLAFVLLNLRGLADPTDLDRQTVDLLFFPTGGGKTEAYLGLAAFTLVLRRLTHPGISSAGVTVLMRYTLRLLTLDQLSRAATLVCALELMRQKEPERLGPWPFEIGLWVGRAATPNRMGSRGDNDPHSAYKRTQRFYNDDKRHPSPIPLETCPWCDTKFKRDSFVLAPSADRPIDLDVYCISRRCDFSGAAKRKLPILAVDEPIYRRLPCFLIATVDKLASLPWVGQVGTLFGKVDRFDTNGFYGAADPLPGRPLECGTLPPPELVIQDELHLISGPLGTMVGLYETAVDALASRPIGNPPRPIGPKVVASTATIRRAEKQIWALFARAAVEIFPPPGPDPRDSYFARTVRAAGAASAPSDDARNARLYLGVAAQGRSLKVVLLRTYLALMGAAQRAWNAAGGDGAAANPADPYMTLLGYFNSLRELGGSRRIVEDEVRSRLTDYGRARRRAGEKDGLFANRTIRYDVLELTSREPTSKVADTKRRLALEFVEPERVDVALATNMISVGLDITRLGLMVVLGQPKTTAEYIQATSRVGRDDERPGLVVTLLNVHRPRDRSHYERFAAFHESFYRSVEATSVTPFAPRAVDRALAAVTVGLARHGLPELTAAKRAGEIERARPKLGFVAEAIGDRAVAHDRALQGEAAEELRRRMRDRVQDLLDAWTRRASEATELQYQRELGGAAPLLFDPLDPELERLTRDARRFKAHRSLRDVEPSVNVWVKTSDGIEVEAEPGTDDP